MVVLVLVLAQLPYFHRCPGPGKRYRLLEPGMQKIAAAVTYVTP